MEVWTRSHIPLVKLAACVMLGTCICLDTTPLLAQTLVPGPPPIPTEILPVDTAHRGRWNFGAQVGYSMEYGFDWHEVSHIQMLIAQPQIGFIAHDFQRSRVRRFEIIDEGILGGTVHPGAYVLGDAVIFRVSGREHGRWVPFLDAGAGAQRTSLFKVAPEVNGFTQFTPQGGFGFEYFVRPQRAMVFEWRTIHMSNANLQLPNMGFNSSMITIGFRWMRRPR
ncbi:MAG: acyloxyacyl hydrolase [Acidobacteriota bacterium]|nr:acyloxyacyl hydrolase [Acidobacteriota bacterium]